MASSNYFRPKLQYWLNEIIGPFVIIPAVVTAISIIGVRSLLDPNDSRMTGLYIILALSWVICIPAFILLSVWAWKTYLNFDNEKLSGYVQRTIFEVYWSDVVAAKFGQDDQKQQILFLGTQQNAFVIPLKYFDDQIIWEKCQSYVPAKALEDKAHEELPGYQQWKIKRENMLNDLSSPLRVATPAKVERIVGWIGVVFFLFIAIVSRESFFLLFVFVGAYLIVPGWIIADSKTISRKHFFIHHQMRWDEIKSVEVDESQSHIVFRNQERILAIPGSASWSGSAKNDLYEFIEAQLDDHQIEVKRTWRAGFRRSKNVRVRSRNE